MNKKKYIIYMGAFLHNSGGSVALHKLCHDLNSLGEEAYITSPKTHPSLNAPFFANTTFKKDNTIGIYPEVVVGNPFGTKHVIRWLLNTPEASGEELANQFYQKSKNTDYFFTYSDFYKIREGYKLSGNLISSFLDTNYFGKGNEIRRGSAFLIKKGGIKEKIHPQDAIDLTNITNDFQRMSVILKNVEYFYCYDNACFWPVIAALCGCISIVVPNTNKTAAEWHNDFPSTKMGIAYGIDEIQHAKETLHLVEQNFKQVQEKELETVKNFIKFCDTI